MLNSELDKLFKDAIAQWNIAERRIKKAEQVKGNEVVNSAIFELRYGIYREKSRKIPSQTMRLMAPIDRMRLRF